MQVLPYLYVPELPFLNLTFIFIYKVNHILVTDDVRLGYWVFADNFSINLWNVAASEQILYLIDDDGEDLAQVNCVLKLTLVIYAILYCT